MAFPLKLKPISLLLCLLLLVSGFLLHADGFKGAEKPISCVSRKLLVVKREEVFKMIVDGKSSKKVEEYGWELRAAPLGQTHFTIMVLTQRSQEPLEPNPIRSLRTC